MIDLAHITQGEAVTNMSLPGSCAPAFTRLFSSPWMQPHEPGWLESQRFGSPRALPL
jgi:hypothetical protein